VYRPSPLKSDLRFCAFSSRRDEMAFPWPRSTAGNPSRGVQPSIPLISIREFVGAIVFRRYIRAMYQPNSFPAVTKMQSSARMLLSTSRICTTGAPGDPVSTPTLPLMPLQTPPFGWCRCCGCRRCNRGHARRIQPRWSLLCTNPNKSQVVINLSKSC
jgi:hypothetical protein